MSLLSSYFKCTKVRVNSISYFMNTVKPFNIAHSQYVQFYCLIMIKVMFEVNISAIFRQYLVNAIFRPITIGQHHWYLYYIHVHNVRCVKYVEVIREIPVY